MPDDPLRRARPGQDVRRTPSSSAEPARVGPTWIDLSWIAPSAMAMAAVLSELLGGVMRLVS